jgi:hypothetical protein
MTGRFHLVIKLRYSSVSGWTGKDDEEYDTFYGCCLALVLAAAAGGWYWLHSGNPDALRQIVLQQCVPNQQQHQTPRRVPTSI